MQTYNLGYDNFGNQTFFKIGDTYTLASYTYGPANGNLTKLQYGNSQYVDYTYDTLARITSEMYNNGTSSTTYNYRYTGDGQLFSVTDSASGRTFVNQYDSLGRVTGYTERSGSDLVQTGSINYDKASRVSREDYSVSGFDGRFYAYNYNPDNGNLLTLHTPDDVTTNYLYDPLHRLVLKDNGLFYAEYSYTPGAGTNATTALPSSLSYSSQGTPWYSTSYIYDQIGNISSQTASDGTIGYTYDAQSQLTREEYDAINYYTYTYDTYGNIRSKNRTENGSTTTKSFTYGDSIWRDKLAAYNGSGISYDNAGNPTYYYDGTSFTWMQGRRLATANNFSKGLSVSYAYNPDGLRLRQTVNGMVHNYVWQGNKLLTESYGTIRLEFMYDETGSPCGFIYNGTPYYYIINLQGDVIQVRDTEGTVQAEYRYNAWGEILSSSGSLASINPIRYRGYYYDAETGLYCVG
ncbi:MAG: hypothetical protein VB064_10275, partial [Oscillospiraceae bacterium]|nr:hypothetical protein [Oscillospiraceae bacterium]